MSANILDFHAFRAGRTADPVPGEDDLEELANLPQEAYWECACGSQSFRVRPDCIVCADCGTVQLF